LQEWCWYVENCLQDSRTAVQDSIALNGLHKALLAVHFGILYAKHSLYRHQAQMSSG
jgi:hypothetical protein